MVRVKVQCNDINRGVNRVWIRVKARDNALRLWLGLGHYDTPSTTLFKLRNVIRGHLYIM